MTVRDSEFWEFRVGSGGFVCVTAIPADIPVGGSRKEIRSEDICGLNDTMK